jgi:hypothetical protein
MSNDDKNLTATTNIRKVSDILLSLEEKILTLTKTVAANDMNNKLILGNLNKLLAKSIEPVISGKMPSVTADTDNKRETPQPVLLEVNKNPPIVNKRQIITKPEVTPVSFELPTPTHVRADEKKSKIPVGQRITDNKGKDLFMADVLVTNLETNEVVNKSKTNAVGKWQTYLPVGKYSVHISKITDSTTLNKIESLQEIEITPQMKSLQLPIAIIKR